MSNNTESNIPVKFTENSNNEWINWIEEAIAKDYFKYYELNHFSNFQEIGFGGLKELKIQREVDFHENIIRFCGIATENQIDNSKKYWLVMEYADGGTLREYLKEHFDNLTWNNKFNMALQLACAILCLHDEGIIHHDLHSKNVLVHQNMVKLADFGLSKRIEESSNLSSTKLFGVIPYIDPKSKPYDVCLAINISQGLRETPIPDTPEDCVNIYTDCWNNEPDNRPTINQVVFKLNAIILKNNNMVIKDFRQTNDSYTNQLSSKQQLDLNAFEDPMNNSSHGELSKFIQEFNKMNTKEIDSSISSNINFMVTVDEMVELSDKLSVDDDELERLLIYNYLNNHNMTSQEIYIYLLNNQNHSNSIVLLGDFNYLGIEINIDKKKAFELYQVAANSGSIIAQYNLGCCYLHGNGDYKDYNKAFELFKKLAEREYSKGINYLGFCYRRGIGTDIDEKKAFELHHKATDLGNTIGINNLGHCYEEGIGTDIDGKKAFELYQKAADLGNAYGINNLGHCYKKGIGTDIDEKKAFELYQKVVDLGNAIGINNLGHCYEKGIGTDIDEKKAFELYQKVADLGNVIGINNLGHCYEKGIGTDIDGKKAFELYQKAADLGNTYGINNLGYCYEKGTGTDIDEKKAFELYQKAADLGNITAQYNLAFMYESGTGILKDINQAIYWYKKSALQGDKDAQNRLEQIHAK
ncbi:uncharacterized protein OCT59_027090 [Rhizophagus irregularis]|uniref:uncharacterized protein n=1 Tax=Rhizophagus irregularis TaxID=588596 RepID=UPI003326E017|nr:hypothetical protein OCT59_027090 [Rhizophagus irregularis]